MSASSRRPEIRRRQTRKVKIDKLRRRYAEATSEADRQKFFEKVKVMSPQMTVEQFTKATAAKS
jgi:hypothetical protein